MSSLSKMPGGAVMGPNGLIHNYNQQSTFSILNDLQSITKLNASMSISNTRGTRNSTLGGSYVNLYTPDVVAIGQMNS